MRTQEFRQKRNPLVALCGKGQALLVFLAVAGALNQRIVAQAAAHDSLPEQVQKLYEAMARTQAQIAQSQSELDEMRKQLAALERQIAGQKSAGTPPVPSQDAQATSSSASQDVAALTSAIEDLRDRQSMQEAQLATHEQTKLESESKYPVKVSGLILFNGFVNTNAVDMPATPALALPGSGSTGASVRQTVLGFDARGPRLFGARSYADLRVDFAGNTQAAATAAGYTGAYNTNATFLRLRTAHAVLQWDRTKAYFSLDRPIFSPDTPTSLTAVAVPALAWSGNLWTWNPQAGVAHDVKLSASRQARFEAALIDVGDAPLSPEVSPSAITEPAVPPNAAEQRRWPGVETHLSIFGSPLGEAGSRFGAGGYFAPHRTFWGANFDSWAATLDARLLLPAHLEFTASAYRGLALGGLGAGAYKDFAYLLDSDSGDYYIRPLNDAGGWAQLKEKFSQRVEINAAFGLDNAFAGDLRRYAVPGGTMYQNLARNRTYSGNIVYSPSAYLLFSLEYRHLTSLPIIGLPADSNVIGLGAGYKF